MPVSARLQGALDSAPQSDATTILTKQDGLPWEPKGNGFRQAWRDACKKAGIQGVTFHDLRGTFVTRKLEEGWTVQEIALCTGHSLRDLASLEKYVDRERASVANAKRVGERSAKIELRTDSANRSAN